MRDVPRHRSQGRYDAAGLPDLRRHRARPAATRAASRSPSRAATAAAAASSSTTRARSATAAAAASPTRTVKARIPAGVKDGQRIRLKGKGAPGERGGPAGDLTSSCTCTPHPLFGRKDDNLTLTLPVTFPEAALGARSRSRRSTAAR